MAKQVINIGAAPNDGTGTPLRTSFDYTNQNFTELYNGSGIGTSTNTQVLFNDSGVANGDAGLVYNKTTDALSVGGAFTATSGDISAANGRINSSGASAALRTSSLTADAFTTTVSTGVGVNNFFSTITIAFTVNNNACSGIIDCQFTGFNQVWGDFLFGSNQTGVVVTMRSAVSAGVTGVLTVTGTGTIYTLVITCPTTVQFPSVNLRVSSGGGAFGGSLMSALPVVTFA